MLIATHTLAGRPLDWAVAKAQGQEHILPIPRYHEDWAAVGPLIRQYRIGLKAHRHPHDGPCFAAASYNPDGSIGYAPTTGDDELEAVLRCVVLHQLGGIVDVPERFFNDEES